MKINQVKGTRLRSLLLGSALVAGLGGLALAQTQTPAAAPVPAAGSTAATAAVAPPPAPPAPPAPFAGAPGGPAFAQMPPPPPPPVDPSTLPEMHGKVVQYDLAPRGEVNGLILADGSEVLFPPHLGQAVQAAVHPGDDVTIRGMRNGTVVMAASVAGPNGSPIVDRGPEAAYDGLPTTDVTGTVKMALHGPAGDVNGVLLDDGTIVRLPPDAASQSADTLRAGQSVAVRGMEVQGPAGKVIDARAFGPSMDRLTQLAVPPRPRPPGPPRG